MASDTALAAILRDRRKSGAGLFAITPQRRAELLGLPKCNGLRSRSTISGDLLQTSSERNAPESRLEDSPNRAVNVRDGAAPSIDRAARRVPIRDAGRPKCPPHGRFGNIWNDSGTNRGRIAT